MKGKSALSVVGTLGLDGYKSKMLEPMMTPRDRLVEATDERSFHRSGDDAVLFFMLRKFLERGHDSACPAKNQERTYLPNCLCGLHELIECSAGELSK